MLVRFAVLDVAVDLYLATPYPPGPSSDDGEDQRRGLDIDAIVTATVTMMPAVVGPVRTVIPVAVPSGYLDTRLYVSVWAAHAQIRVCGRWGRTGNADYQWHGHCARPTAAFLTIFGEITLHLRLCPCMRVICTTSRHGHAQRYSEWSTPVAE